MQSLPRRSELPLEPEDIVVRGGLMARAAVASGVRTCFARFGVHGLSTMAGPGASIEELFLRSRALQGYGQCRWVRVGDVWEHGLAVYATFASPHYTLELPCELDDDMWRVIDHMFSVPTQAPGR